jgi:hypothetical protein
MKTVAFAFIAWCFLIAPAFSQGNDCDTLDSCQAATKKLWTAGAPRSTLFQVSKWQCLHLEIKTFREEITGEIQRKTIGRWNRARTSVP